MNLIYTNSRGARLTFAAGSRSGESYIVASALKTVVERHYPRIVISLLETGGTVENLNLIESGKAGLAVAQADVLAGPSARIVAVLYDDSFQLLAHLNANIQSFSGLRGKIIALPRSGGQFRSFLRIAQHFALAESDFRFIGSTDADADQVFTEGRADAVFRVRAIGNPGIRRLVESGGVHFVRIEHAAAMKLAQPAFEPCVIPAGAYLGAPAVPAEDLPSISVHRALLAAANMDDQIVRAIAETLIDRRQELAAAIPESNAAARLLLAQVRRPEVQSQLAPAVHPGALGFYEKDKPSFVQAHSDFLGFVLTVAVMFGSWIWELRAWLQRKQKNVADCYSNRVVGLINEARAATSFDALDRIHGELLDILTMAVGDLDNDKLSEEAFHSFRAILQIGLEVVRECTASLPVGTRSSVQATG